MGARVVLGAVGAVVGGYFGGPQGAQLGWAIGSTIGGIIDPDVIKGPQIGDTGTPTTSDGTPIPWVHGKGPVTGHLLCVGPKIKRVSREQQGKGGPIVESEYETMTFAVAFGRGEIEAFMRVWMDEKLIYDVSTDANTSAAAVSASGSRFTALAQYRGTPDQLPAPILEGIFGVGTTPAYRNRCYMIFQDFNFTSAGNRLPVIRAEVVVKGSTDVIEQEFIVAPDYGRFVNRRWPLLDEESFYSYYGSRVGSDGSGHIFTGDTIQGVIDQFNALGDYGGLPADEYLGYCSASNDDTTATAGSPDLEHKLDVFGTPSDVTDNASLVLFYNVGQPAEWIDTVIYIGAPDADPGGTPCFTASSDILRGDAYGFLFKAFPFGPLPVPWLGARGCFSETGATIGAIPPIWIKVTRKKRYRTPDFNKPCGSEEFVLIPDSPLFAVDCDATIISAGESTTLSGFFKTLKAEYVPADGNDTKYIYYQLGPVLQDSDPNYNNEAFWTDAYDQAVADGKLPAGWTYNAQYPQPVSSAVARLTSSTLVNPEAALFNDIVTEVCAEVDIGPERLDLTLTEGVEIDGLTLAKAMGGDSAILTMCQILQIDPGSWDGKLHFIPKGRPSVRTLQTRDLVRVGGPPVKQVIEQGIERAKSLRLAYQDPATNYIPTTQVSGQINPDLTAVSEGVISTPVVMTATRALQAVDRLRKEARANVEGEISFSVGPADSDLTVTDNVKVPRAGGLLRVRITKTDDEFGIRRITGRIDRPSSYQSTRIGVDRPPVTDPMQTLIGPTLCEVMNLPALVDGDDRPGVYVAMAGLLGGWSGALVEASTNGSVYQELINSNLRATIGTTQTVLPDATELVVDTVNTLRVKVHGTTLQSITEEQFNANGNAFALVYPDKTAEICQFKTATLIDTDVYDLSYLTRGRKATATGEHQVGTAFVMLSGAQFCPVPLSWIGQTITWRVTSRGTSQDTGWTDFAALSPAWSQSEWSPTFLQGERDTSGFVNLTWNARGRLGTSANPFPSQLFDGFRVQFISGDQIEQVQLDKNTTHIEYDPAPVFGSDELTIRVFQTNTITGLSPEYAEIIL